MTVATNAASSYDHVLPPRREREANIFYYFPWLPVEAALSSFDVRFFLLKQFFEKELVKTKEIAMYPES